MLAFLIRRLAQGCIVILAVAVVPFSLFQYVCDPLLAMLGQNATPEKYAALRAELGLDRPFWVQFFHFVVNALHGDFGISLRQGRPVFDLLRDRLPATLELSFAAAALALT